MDVHKNARLTPHSRAELVRRVLAEGQALGVVARGYGVSLKTARKCVARFRVAGSGGLAGRELVWGRGE